MRGLGQEEYRLLKLCTISNRHEPYRLTPAEDACIDPLIQLGYVAVEPPAEWSDNCELLLPTSLGLSALRVHETVMSLTGNTDIAT
jgi:hypothetical protein